MAATERSLDQEFDALRKDLDSLKSTLTRKGMKAVDSAVTQARSTGEQGMAAIETHIVDRPLTSVLIAFAAGVLIGKLTDR
jgi:ElaB/YqjD/DUF883 family membrane-anchored ribosome-binding protein